MMYERMMEVTFRHIALKMAGLLRPASILLLSALTALAMVSCGGSEDTPDTPEPPVPPEPLEPKTEFPIAFSGSLSESESETATRAESPVPLQEYPDAEHGHTTFHAWSYKNTTASTTEVVMQDYIVNWTAGSAGSTTTNSRNWEYVNQQTSGTEQSIKYWDFTAADYRFFGYTGTGVTVAYSPNVSAPTTVTLSCTYTDASAAVSASTPLYSKLWRKTTGEIIASNVQPVTLPFLQPIARVRIIFTFVPELIASNIGRDDLSDISFRPTNSEKNIAIGGTVTITYPLTNDTGTKESWSSGDGDATAFFDNPRGICIDSYKDNDDNWVNTWYNVLPRTSQGTYTLSVVVSGGEPKTCIVPAEFMTWAPGYQYTYIFKITETGGITLDNIQVGINDWHMVEQITHPVHNW